MNIKNRVIVAGSRDYENYKEIEKSLDYYLSNINKEDLLIISGGAKGVDSLAIQYATEHGVAYMVFPAFWEKYGNSAGYIRNKLMADEATHLIAFHKNNSKGTANMIDLAKNKGLKIRVKNV